MEPYFISDNEFQKFQGFYLPRFVKKAGSTTEGRERAVDVISSQIRHIARRQALNFYQEAILIRAEKNDGLSWACEEIASFLHSSFFNWNRYFFKGSYSKNELPEIIKYTGFKHLIKIMKNAKLLDLNIFPSIAKISVLFLIAIALTFFADLLSSNSSDLLNKLRQNIGFLPLNLILIVTMTTIPIIVNVIVNHIKLEKDSQVIDRVANILKTEKRLKEYEDIVDKISQKFVNLQSPKCVIIDDFSRLDSFSQDVLQKALTNSNTSSSGALLWIILETVETSYLSKRVTVDPFFMKNFCDGRHTEYKLDHFSFEERVKILEKNDLPSEIAKIQVLVKNLIRGVADEEIAKLRNTWTEFIQLESKTDKEIGVSDLFRVMALNSFQPAFDLSRNKFMSILSQKKGLFNTLLSLYFQKNFLLRDEVQRGLSAIFTKFGQFLIATDDPNEPVVIKTSALPILMEDTKALIPHDSIHFFWLIHWFRISQHDFDSYQKLQKFAYHATYAGIRSKMIDTESGKNLCFELFEILNKVTDACLHKTLFRQALIVGTCIIRNTRILFDDYSNSLIDFNSVLTKVLDSCWKIYSITNNEPFLQELLLLLSNIELPAVKTSDSVLLSNQTNTYLRLNNIPQDLREIAARRIEQIASQNKRLLQRVNNNMTLSVAEIIYFLDKFAENKLLDAYHLTSYENISHQIDSEFDIRAYESIDSQENETYSILDYQNIKGCIRNLIRSGQYDHAKDWIETFVLKTSEMDSRSKLSDSTAKVAKSEQLSLLERALLLENLAVCMDSLITTISRKQTEKLSFPIPTGEQHYTFAQSIYLNENVKYFADVTSLIYSILGEHKNVDCGERKPIPISILEKTEELYLQAALAWEEFGLEEMRDRVFMQRAQFLFELSSITSNEPETYDEIFKSLAHSLTLQSSLGLSSHLLLAWFLSPLPDLSSYYLLECANRIIDGSFDDDLKVFFGITALDSSSRVTSKSAKVADFIVQMFEDIELLETTISRHGTDKMVRTIHDLFEVTRITKNEELFLKIRKIAERLLLRAEFCIKDKLRVFLDFHDLQNKNNKGENININETLSRWENWKEHWLYSSVLELSFNNRRADQTLIVKSLDYLESRESPFTASSHVHLLHKIVDEVVKGNANKYYQRCTNLLIRKVVPILQNYSVQNALITFELLSQIDATNIVTHHQYHAQWNAIQLERVKIENLGHMIEKGYFWGVFDNYFRALLIYGLPISRNDESFCEKVLNAKPDSYLEIFKAYDLDEQLRLTKIVDGQEVILFDFICIGRMAFSSGIQGLPIVDELRHKINHVTKNQIGHFFNIIASTQSIPLILRDIISQHRKELSV